MNDVTTRGLQDSPTDAGSSTDSGSDCYPPNTGAIGADDLFEALSNSRRRHVIRALEDGECDLGPLSRAIAAIECDVDVEAVTGQQRKRVYIGLYQTHLDQLERWDVIEWDGTSHTLAPGPAHEAALEAIRAVAQTNCAEETEPKETPSTWRDRIAGFIPGDAA